MNEKYFNLSIKYGKFQFMKKLLILSSLLSLIYVNVAVSATCLNATDAISRTYADRVSAICREDYQVRLERQKVYKMVKETIADKGASTECFNSCRNETPEKCLNRYKEHVVEIMINAGLDSKESCLNLK